MEGWQLGLLIWSSIAMILVFIIRGCLGQRDKAWKEYKEFCGDFSDSELPNGCFGIIGSLILLPGVAIAALYDWIIVPMLFWPGRKAGDVRRSKAFKEAVKRLPPFERE